MRGNSTQVLKNINDPEMVDGGTKKLKAAVRSVRPVISEAKPAELLVKEESCCNGATD